MRVVVTGGAGFIGSNLVCHLINARGWRVAVIDKLTYAANLASLAPVSESVDYRFVKADICDRAALDQILWLESDRMGHLLGVIDQARLDEQRGVVQNEKRQGENQRKSLCDGSGRGPRD